MTTSFDSTPHSQSHCSDHLPAPVLVRADGSVLASVVVVGKIRVPNLNLSLAEVPTPSSCLCLCWKQDMHCCTARSLAANQGTKASVRSSEVRNRRELDMTACLVFGEAGNAAGLVSEG